MTRFVPALLLVVAASFAQPAAAASTAAPAATVMHWTAISGKAVDLSVGADGAVFAVDDQGKVWLRRPGGGVPWVNLPGAFHRIAAASEKLAWAVGEAGTLYAYNGTWWRPMSGRFDIRAADVGMASDGTVYVVTSDGKLVRLDARHGRTDIPGAPAQLTRVAVDDADQPWVIDSGGHVHRFDGKHWLTLENVLARDLSAANGQLWLVAQDGQLLTFAAMPSSTTRPQPIAARVAVVAGAPGRQPWIATADGHIFTTQPNTGGVARPTRVEREQVFTQLLNWQRVSGQAQELAISPGGAILALDREGGVWQWKGRNNWGRLPGRFARVALDRDNTPWGIDAEGRPMRYGGSYWTALPGSAKDIAAGADGSVWILLTNGALAHWNAHKHDWQGMAVAPPAGARRIAIAPDGQPWLVDATGAVLRLDGKQWSAMPELEATEIGIGPGGTVFVTSPDKRLWRWDRLGKRWEHLNGEATSVAVGPGGKPWITTGDAQILASAFFDELPDSQVNTTSVAAANAAAAKLGAGGMAAGTPSGAQIVGTPGTSNLGAPQGNPTEPLLYRKVSGVARDIAIGADGSVFVVTYDGGLARWSNTRNAFLAFPGQFARIAVAPNGNPWGVTTQGEVFRNDGVYWKLVRNVVAQDISIGYDGTVVIADSQGYLEKYDPAGDRFARLPVGADGVPPTGVRVAVDPAGKPWVITSDGYVVRCDHASCERLPVKARSIAIGPEGSIVIVDADRVLRRWNERDGEFDRIDSISDPIELAAVGPRGKPWLLSTASEVWASEFFLRDESHDIATTATTASIIDQSSISGNTAPPVFTFLINMPFESIPISGPVTNAGDPSAVSMEVLPDGNPVLIDLNANFWTYNPVTKRMERDSTVPVNPSISSDGKRSFAIGKDGAYWVTTRASHHVYRYLGGQWTEVYGLNDSCSWCQPMTVAVGPDGTVYGTSESGKLYRYDTALRRFVIMSLPLPAPIQYVGVDASNHIWAVSVYTGKIYEYTGNAWLSHNDNTVTNPSVCIDSSTKCFAIGANGSVYTTATGSPYNLVRWNASSRVWETISSSPNTTDGTYAVGPDGRPWVIDQGSPDILYRAK